MLSEHWPIAGLRIRTPDLELRWPTTEELVQVAEVAAEGIHDPGFMPFTVPWTDASPEERARSVILHFWRQAGLWTKDEWQLNLIVFRDGQATGIQTIGSARYAVTREVHTGSWLGQRFHGQGIGTQMRTAVLELAFAGLGAESATSGAYAGNDASLAVSRKLGYREDGVDRDGSHGEMRFMQRLRLDRPDWNPPFEVTIDGLEPCREWFGL